MSNIWWSLDEYTRLAIGMVLWFVFTGIICYIFYKIDELFRRMREKRQKRASIYNRRNSSLTAKNRR